MQTCSEPCLTLVYLELDTYSEAWYIQNPAKHVERFAKTVTFANL